MRKFFLTFIAALMICNPVLAKGHGHHGPAHHRPVHHYRGAHKVGDLVWGAAGVVAGATLISSLISSNNRSVMQQPKVYVVEPEDECYITVSRKSGEVKEKCFNQQSKGIIYID
jgi:hypothetical protein